MNRVQHGNYFENRHESIHDPSFNTSHEVGESYLLFMDETILPRIDAFQDIIRKDILYVDVRLIRVIAPNINYNFAISSATLEFDMKEAKVMETTSLVLLLLVILLSPIIIFLIKSATSTIQVSNNFPIYCCIDKNVWKQIP